MEAIGARRISLTTWAVLGLCVLAGVVAVAMTAVVIVRLNRQVLASAAELRAGIPGSASGTTDPAKQELIDYASAQANLEAQWAQTLADYRAKYPGSGLHESVATAQALTSANAMRRPASVAPLHERWAQAWSDRDAAFALLGKPTPSDDDRSKAAELGRRASDEIRRVRNELRDMLAQRGATEAELAAARLGS